MSHPLRLLATDFDGTLMTLGVEPHANTRDSFQSWVQDIQEHGGAWALCTGRDYSSFRMAYPFLECPGIMPDFVVTRRGRVFERRGKRYALRALISLRVIRKRMHASRRTRRVMKQALAFVNSGREQVGGGDVSARRIRVFLGDDDSSARVARRIEQLQGAGAYLAVRREGHRVEIRPVPQSKGIALGELQRLLGVDHTETMAVGDGINDLSMFDASVSRWTGCPANSVRSVVDAIVQRGGHVARQHGIGGTVEVISACMSGEVSARPLSTPTGILPPAEPLDGLSTRMGAA